MGYSLIDLFSGAGGLSEGLSGAGFDGLFANEFVEMYARTYAKNHPSTKVSTRDIREIDADEVMRKLGLARGQLDLLAGGPPCQGFSINAPVRSTKDARNHLFREYLRFVDAFAPRMVLIENVPGLVSFEHGATLHAILDSLAELGYGADVRILGAAYYGVPQMRWRTIVIGARGKELPAEAFPLPICRAPIRANFTACFDGRSIVQRPGSEVDAGFVSVKEAIGDLPPLKNGEKGDAVKQYAYEPFSDYQRRMRKGSTGVYNHEASRLSKANVERMGYIKPGGNWVDIPDELLPKGMQRARKSDHTKRYGRVTADGLASTILTKCDPHWGHTFITIRIAPSPFARQRASNRFLTDTSSRAIRRSSSPKSAMRCPRFSPKPLAIRLRACCRRRHRWQASFQTFSVTQRKINPRSHGHALSKSAVRFSVIRARSGWGGLAKHPVPARCANHLKKLLISSAAPSGYMPTTFGCFMLSPNVRSVLTCRSTQVVLQSRRRREKAAPSRCSAMDGTVSCSCRSDPARGLIR